MMGMEFRIRKIKPEENSPHTTAGKNETTSIHKLKSHFKTYCKHTGIHGFQYFGQNRTIIEKCWWTVIFIFSLLGCGYAIYQIYNKWRQSPVIVSLTTKETPIYKIPFPAVTICPSIKYSKECINFGDLIDGNETDISKERRNILEYTASLCQWGDKLKQMPGAKQRYSDEIYKTFLNCSPFLESETSVANDVSFMGQRLDFREHFRPFVTEDGLCFSFNMLSTKDIFSDKVHMHPDFFFSDPDSQWIPQYGYEKKAAIHTYPRRALWSGVENSLKIIIPHRKLDIDYLCTGAEQGYKVILHFPTRVPRPILEYTMAPFGKASMISVTGYRMATSDVVKSYSPDNRDCYFEGEKKLQFFKTYTITNCAFECLTNFTLKECGCVGFYMPRNSSTPICGIPDLKCISLARKKYLIKKLIYKIEEKATKEEEGVTENSNRSPRQKREDDISWNDKDEDEASCYCLRACSDITYTGSATVLDYNWNKMSVEHRSGNITLCWWIIILLLCLGGCTNMIYEVCKKWIDTPVLVSLATKDTSINKIPFPAVTICPESKISRQCVNYSKVLRMRRAGEGDLVPENEKEVFDNMALLCKAENHLNSTSSSKLNDYSEFLNRCKSVNLNNSHCMFGGFEMNCTDILQPILTDEGLCYSFNMFDVRDIYSDVNQMTYYTEGQRKPDYDIDNGYPDLTTRNFYPRRVLSSGAGNSLVVVLLTKKADVYYSCRDFALQGMRVALHMPARIPRPNQVYFPVGLNELVVAPVTPTYMGTTPKIREYDYKKRNCFFGTERKLKYFRMYTQSNCNLECWTNYTIQECGCTHFYMPRDAKTSICPLDRRQCLQTASETFAVSNFPKKYHKEKKSKGKLNSDCNCLPICSDLNYNAEVSRGKWNWNDPNGANVGHLKKYFKDYHASAVKVFFKSSYFLPTEKSELYGVVDFLSNTGGILGLFTGFSLFSLAEIVYFLSVRLIENYRQFGYWAGQREH